MIDAEFVNKIVDLSTPKLISVEGRTYSSKSIVPVEEPRAKALIVNTLTGLVDYLDANIDALAPDAMLLHVESPTLVSLISTIGGAFPSRTTWMQAKHIGPVFQFGQAMEIESFIVGLQALFVPSDNMASILKVIGNVKDSVVTNYNDNGVTQAVTAKSGISMVEKVQVPNPVILTPRRTFTEAEQPASQFVFRVKQRDGQPPSCALFEADGGAWKSDAMGNVKAWLNEKTKGTVKIIS